MAVDAVICQIVQRSQHRKKCWARRQGTLTRRDLPGFENGKGRRVCTSNFFASFDSSYSSLIHLFLSNSAFLKTRKREQEPAKSFKLGDQNQTWLRMSRWVPLYYRIRSFPWPIFISSSSEQEKKPFPRAFISLEFMGCLRNYDHSFLYWPVTRT